MPDESVVACRVMCDGYRCHASTSSWLRMPQTYHPHGCVDLFPSRRFGFASFLLPRATPLRLTSSLRTSYFVPRTSIPSPFPCDKVIAHHEVLNLFGTDVLSGSAASYFFSPPTSHLRGGDECGRMAVVKNVPVFVLALAIFLCGCSVKRRVARVMARVDTMYERAPEWEQLPEKSITWDQALSMMRKNNLQMREADDAIRQAERDSLSVYTDMIPGLSYYSYITRSISRLTEPVESGEMSTTINMTFSMPALTQVPYRVYSAKIRTIAAIKAKEGRSRENISQLYKRVREREVETEKRLLNENAPEQENQPPQQDKLKRDDTDRQYWRDMARLLGDHSARWNILPESMPHIRWDDYEKRLDKLSELVVCQFAMRLEQARMAQYSVALNYLPTINTSLYSPSLFSSSGGTYQGTFLDKDDTRINMSISYRLDTELYTWDTYQQSKARYEREKLKVADELIDHRTKVQKLRASMNEYSTWKSFMSKNIAYLRSQSPATAEEFVERSKRILSMQNELLNQELSAIESEAALVLEYGMP